MIYYSHEVQKDPGKDPENFKSPMEPWIDKGPETW